MKEIFQTHKGSAHSFIICVNSNKLFKMALQNQSPFAPTDQKSAVCLLGPLSSSPLVYYQSYPS